MKKTYVSKVALCAITSQRKISKKIEKIQKKRAYYSLEKMELDELKLKTLQKEYDAISRMLQVYYEEINRE